MIVDLVRNGRRKILAWIGKIYLRATQRLWEEAIRKIVVSDEQAFFMEIGSWDGIGADLFYPLIKQHKIAGILIEPHESAFRILKENYAYHDKVIFENVAVAEKDGIKPLFFVSLNSQAIVPAHASLHKEVVKREIAFLQQEHVLPSGEHSQYIASRPIECMSISSILDKHGINKVDMLQIDTEGYEYEILESLPFDRINPRLIRCEFTNMEKTAYRESIKIFRENGYSVILQSPDIIAAKDINGIQLCLLLGYLIGFFKDVLYKFVPWPQRTAA